MAIFVFFARFGKLRIEMFGNFSFRIINFEEISFRKALA